MSGALKSNDKLKDLMRVRMRNLSPSLVRVLEFIDSHRHETMTKSAMELAAAIGTSDATVVRAVQALGFDGLRELRQALATASGTGNTPLDAITRTCNVINERSITAADQVFADHRETMAALEGADTRASIIAAIECLTPANRIGIFGGGAPAFLGRYLALCLNQVGRATAVFDGYMGPLAEQLLEMRDVNAMLMMAFGGTHSEATSTMAEARRFKVPVVLLTDSREPTLARHASIVVPITCSQSGRVIMHGATMVCLEAIIMGMVAADPPRTFSTLERLKQLRTAICR